MVKDNYDYLFWGHFVFWVFIIGYIYYLARKNNALKKELEALDESSPRSENSYHRKTEKSDNEKG